jgi:hypothetical protein
MTLVLALDLASVTGWALGRVGDDMPRCGSLRFARKSASEWAIAAGALDWLIKFTAEHRPDVLAMEDTLPSTFVRGRTNKRTNDILGGLVFLSGAVLYKRGCFKINRHSVSNVRSHFIDMNACAREEAKLYTIRKCRSLGWLDAADDDAADALALWSYQCSLMDPRQAIRVSPLWQKGVAL